jgi:RNA-binding protein
MRRNVKRNGLKELGTVLHILDNKLIVRGERMKLKIKKITNSVVMTREKRKVGKVYDVFGPVNAPYVGVKAFKDVKEEELRKLLNKKIYVF